MEYKVGDEVVYNLDNPEMPEQPCNADWGIVVKIEDDKVHIKHPFGDRIKKIEIIPIAEFEKGIRNTEVISGIYNLE